MGGVVKRKKRMGKHYYGEWWGSIDRKMNLIILFSSGVIENGSISIDQIVYWLGRM